MPYLTCAGTLLARQVACRKRQALDTLLCVQSVLARGLHALLPPIEVIKGSYCNANPENRREWEVRYIYDH